MLTHYYENLCIESSMYFVAECIQSKQIVDSRKLFFTEEFQLINEEGMKVLEKSPLCAHSTIIDLGRLLMYAEIIR